MPASVRMFGAFLISSMGEANVGIVLGMLPVFDVVILEMLVFFLLLAWLARCKIPWRVYRDIVLIVLVFAFQVRLLL